jgi:hypothetical protein
MCETAITHALQAVPNNLSALQTMASFRISQCRPEDACIILENLVNIVNQQLQQYTNRKITDELLNANSIDSAVPPTIEFLISFCKLLIECSCHREKFSVVGPFFSSSLFISNIIDLLLSLNRMQTHFLNKCLILMMKILRFGIY